jgi:hypothetical protein
MPTALGGKALTRECSRYPYERSATIFKIVPARGTGAAESTKRITERRHFFRTDISGERPVRGIKGGVSKAKHNGRSMN